MLLSYIGCGNFPDADIIVFGNEEGTGGYSVEANVKARVELYGRDSNSSAAPTYLIDPNDWTKGFYEPSASGGAKKVENYVDSANIQQSGFVAGVFNPSIARICLALEDPSLGWFSEEDESAERKKEAWARIKSYIINDLYEPRKGIQTALADWRPLPRANESTWYPEEYGDIANSLKNNQYLDVFNRPDRNTFNNKNYTKPEFSNFTVDRLNRSDTLKRLFQFSKAKVVIGIGGANGFKKKALEMMFGKDLFTPLAFDTVDMRNNRGHQIQSFTAQLQLEDKTIHVFLIPFPSVGQIFKTQKDSLGMLKELTERYIKPIIES